MADERVLQKLKKKELKALAREAGISNEEIDDAGEADDEKQALVDLLLAAGAGSSTGQGPRPADVTPTVYPSEAALSAPSPCRGDAPSLVADESLPGATRPTPTAQPAVQARPTKEQFAAGETHRFTRPPSDPAIAPSEPCLQLEPVPPKNCATSKLRPVKPTGDGNTDKKLQQRDGNGENPRSRRPGPSVYLSKLGGGRRRTAMMAGSMDAGEAERLTDLMVDSLYSNTRVSGTESNLAMKVRGFSSLFLIIALIVYEIFWFEWADYKDRGALHGEFGYTGPTMLWAVTMLWSLSQVFFSFLHLGSAKFRELNHEQQLKVVKYCIQVTWGGTMAALYVVFQLCVRRRVPPASSSSLHFRRH